MAKAMERSRKTASSILGWINRLFPFTRTPNSKGNARVGAAEKYILQERSFAISAQGESVNESGRSLRVAALCGSLRQASNNRGLIRAAIEVAKESIPGMEIELIDISELPFLNTDLEKDGTFPDVVEDFRNKFKDFDCILFSTPEYNYSVTAVLKNAIDWASRSPNVMAGKPAAIMSAAGQLGGARAQYHLRQIGVYLDLHFVNKPELFVNGYSTPKPFDDDGNLVDEDIRARVKKLLLALQELATKLLS